MCGIAGTFFVVKQSSNASTGGIVSRMSEHLRSRGPDASGHFQDTECDLNLVHRRLSIIDLNQRSNQPMISDDGRYVIIFNGEIYNFKELRIELENEGEVFNTQSDTEVVLKLFSRDKESMLKRLRGMFAFAIWDCDKKELFLARDPYGIKPLYIAKCKQGWLFASQVKTLLASGVISQEPNLEAQSGFWSLGSVPEPYTWFRDINALPAGTFCRINSKGEKTEPIKYWEIADSWREASNCLLSKDIIANDVTDALMESIKCHLVSDVPVGVFLSGGIDSSALVGLMKDAGVRQIEGITIAYDEFKGTFEDEVPVAAQVAKYYDIRHHIRRVTKEEFIADLPKILNDMDQPSIDGINTWYASKAVAELGLKVVVSGIGGDELFLGYPSFSQLPRLTKAMNLLKHIPGAMKVANIVFRRKALTSGNSRWKYTTDWSKTIAGAWWLRRSMYSPDDLLGLMDSGYAEKFQQSFNVKKQIESMIGKQSKNSILALAQIESMVYLRNQLLRDSDWASMAHGVELRTPLVDAYLLSQVEPYLSLFHKFSNKSLLANAPRKPLPHQIINRNKTGFGIPVERWLSESGIIPASKMRSRELAKHVVNAYESWAP